MPDDDDWHDATIVGSAYEQQISRAGRWRHRPLRLGGQPRDPMEDRGIGEWRNGTAPDMNTRRE